MSRNMNGSSVGLPEGSEGLPEGSEGLAEGSFPGSREGSGPGFMVGLQAINAAANPLRIRQHKRVEIEHVLFQLSG